jgi:hypothetical protein
VPIVGENFLYDFLKRPRWAARVASKGAGPAARRSGPRPLRKRRGAPRRFQPPGNAITITSVPITESSVMQRGCYAPAEVSTCARRHTSPTFGTAEEHVNQPSRSGPQWTGNTTSYLARGRYKPSCVSLTRKRFTVLAGLLSDAAPVDRLIDRMLQCCQAEGMGILDRLLGRRPPRPEVPVHADDSVQDAADGPLQPREENGESDNSWYVPHDGDPDRFVGSNGVVPLHLIRYRDTSGELVLRLCEDTTGLLVGRSDRRLPRAGIYVSQLRGEAYHRAACKAGDFRPGASVRLVREPENEFDPNAVSVYDATGQHLAAYVNKQKARMLSRLIDAGKPVEAVSIRGTGPGRPCDQVAVLAAAPDIL